MLLTDENNFQRQRRHWIIVVASGGAEDTHRQQQGLQLYQPPLGAQLDAVARQQVQNVVNNTVSWNGWYNNNTNDDGRRKDGGANNSNNRVAVADQYADYYYATALPR